MRPAQFEHSTAGRVVRVRRDGADYWAFVPLPLPPALDMDRELARLLAEASGALGELRGLGRSLTNPHLLTRPFIRREAVLSSRIEGTRTTIAELYAYEAGQLPLPGMDRASSDADTREVVNYVRALEYGLARLDTLPLSLRFIRELHERLMEGVRGEHATPGEFRYSQNWIGAPGSVLDNATFVPPPLAEMRDALDAFERYLHADDGYHPLIRLAFIHYQFEAIHPFLDGNGRIGRLLITLLLAHWELLPVPLLYLSAFFERHRDDYYGLLLAVSQRGGWREWVSFVLQGVESEARDAAQRARRLQELERAWRARVAQERTSPSLVRLVESLFEVPYVTVADAQRRLGMSYNTAQRGVERLMRLDILRQVGRASYGRVFVAEDVLRIAGGHDPSA